MEQYRKMRAYSAGGVVFRLGPTRSTDAIYTDDPRPNASASVDGPLSVGARFNTFGLDKSHDAVEVALVGRSRAGIWALPKGTPKPGETIEQVAIREVQEETGLKVRMIAYVGSISYSFVRGQVRYHKQVRHFLFEAIGGDTVLHDHEYDLVEWFPISEAARCLTYQNEVNILNQAEEVLQRWLQSRHRHKEGS